jgi:hypothetical protein
VLSFVPGLSRASLYGLDKIQAVAEALPDVEFRIVGWLEGDRPKGPRNLTVYGRSEDLKPFYQQASVLWRPVQHDAGVSFMVLEALAQGRHVIYSYPFPASIQAATAEEAQCEIQRMLRLHAAGNLLLNQAGIKVVDEVFSPEKVRATLFQQWEQIISSAAENEAGLPEQHKLRNSSAIPR